MRNWKRILWGADPRATLLRAVALGLGLVLLIRYVALPVRVAGASMEPTIRDGSLRLVNLLKFRWRDPRRGEVVVIPMTGRKALFLKRVLGLPGEGVSFLDGQLFIDGRPQPEPYLDQRGAWRLTEVPVEAGHYFVAGDNRLMAIEEHTLGLVARDRLIGGLWF